MLLPFEKWACACEEDNEDMTDFDPMLDQNLSFFASKKASFSSRRDLALHLKESLGLDHSVSEIESAISDNNTLFDRYDRISDDQLDVLSENIYEDLTGSDYPFRNASSGFGSIKELAKHIWQHNVYLKRKSNPDDIEDVIKDNMDLPGNGMYQLDPTNMGQKDIDTVTKIVLDDLAPSNSKKAANRPRPPHLPSYLSDEPNVDSQGTDLDIWAWEERGKYMVLAYQGKGQKPVAYYAQRSEPSRDSIIKELIDGRKEAINLKLQKLNERKQFKHTFAVGDILYSSYGYDQTNVDWYQVVGLKDKAIVIREITSKIVGGYVSSNNVVPVPNSFAGPPMVKIPQLGGRVKINSSSTAYAWDGLPKHETAAGWGR